MNPLDTIRRGFKRLSSRSAIKNILSWHVPLILIGVALLLTEGALRLPIVLTYLSIMIFLLIIKADLDRRIADQSAIEQLRSELTAHRETTSVIGYLNSVLEPSVPIWYSRAYQGYTISPEMLAEVFNRIVKEKPRAILEIGSGLSTLVASYAVQKNGFGQVVSWDVVEPRASRVRELLDSHDQKSHVKVVSLSPFDKQDASDEILWDDGHAPEKIDFLIVDATSDSSKNPEHMKAVETVKPMLAIGCTIFIHDSFEARDREAVAEWMSEIRELSLVHTKQASTHKYSFLRFGNGFLFKE
jgi:hypothetical protein